MKKGLRFILAGAAGALPFVAFAQTKNFFDLVNVAGGIIQVIVPFVIGLAVLVIIWGIFGYITGAGDEEKRGEAKQYIIWGIIGLFVMTAIWGLVGIVSSTLNLAPTAVQVPTVIPCPDGKAPKTTVDANGKITGVTCQ